jgi:3-deoxy-D-manno-octulosonic-acid transferase
MASNAKSPVEPEPFGLKFYAGFASCIAPVLHLSKPLLSKYGGFRDTVPERLGDFSSDVMNVSENRKGRKLVWIHAVSVGEAACSGPIIDSIRERNPDVFIAISTTTFTGRDFIKKNLDPDLTFFFPLDIPSAQKKLVDILKPDCFVDVEVELWPNCFRALVNAGVPLVLANGRISDRSANPPPITRGVYKWLFSSLDGLFMRSKEDVERVIRLGAPKDRTHLAGNLKFAAAGKPLSLEERNTLRKKLGAGEGDKIFVAGSTHPGEDEQVLDAYIKIKGKIGENVVLVVAPRHLEQVERILGLIKSAGEKCVRWSQIGDTGASEKCIVVDTIGELIKIYGASDVALVCGSMVKRGGHNVLEPVAVGTPAVHGQSMDNFHDLKKVLDDANLIREVADSDDLAETVVEILNTVNRDEYYGKARELIDRQQKASDMIADFVVSKL